VGPTEAEVLRNLQSVTQMVVESMIEHGERVPEGLHHEVEVTVEPRVVITV
jgi:predicted RNase H-like HicB family nuclease